jgi:hypothetical protein
MQARPVVGPMVVCSMSGCSVSEVGSLTGTGLLVQGATSAGAVLATSNCMMTA